MRGTEKLQGRVHVDGSSTVTWLNSDYANRAIGGEADGCHAQLVAALLIFGLIVVVALLLAIEIRVRTLLGSTDDEGIDPPERPSFHRARK